MSGTVDIETRDGEATSSPCPSRASPSAPRAARPREELQQQRAKEAKERTGNDLEVVKERQEAKRTQEKLQRVVFVRQGDMVKHAAGGDRRRRQHLH